MYFWTLVIAGGVFCSISFGSCESNGNYKPVHVWPLGNASLYSDIIGTQDVIHDQDQVCFAFVDGPESLPYSIIDKEEQENSCFDVNLRGPAPLRDLTISMFVYPHNDASDISGTLLHYQSEDREILRIRTLANTFLVSFRDEYGMSAGMMYLVNLLTPRAWNHVTVVRDYKTGRIIVYKNGEEVFNDDDEFSDVIGFPHTGKLRIGKSLDPDDEGLFEGNFACIQVYERMFSKDRLADILKYCQPENWKMQYDYYFDQVDDKWCLADRPLSEEGIIVNITVLTRGALWKQFLRQTGMTDSGQNYGYLKLKSHDKKPLLNDDLIGQFNATDGKVCVRLCMRVDGCMSVLVEEPGNTKWYVCSMYEDTPITYQDSPGSKFYVLFD